MEIKNLIKLYKDPETGLPLILTEGQARIFETIASRSNPRNIILAPTRYGKSMTIALAVLLRLISFPEKWAIVAPREKQAKIIMNHLIGHIFDNEIFRSQLILNEPLERLKTERSKSRLTFKRGGEVFILSSDARSEIRQGESVLGFGAQNVIIDESSLIPDLIYGNILRMLGDDPDSFLVEIGNPFYRNHFYESWNNPAFTKLFIDWKQAVNEGRFTLEFITEMQHHPQCKILYDCKFPDESEQDLEGYTVLIMETIVNNARVDIRQHKGVGILGVDVGGGHDRSVMIHRSETQAEIIYNQQLKDVMALVAPILKFYKELKCGAIAVDKTGIGWGLFNRLQELRMPVTGVHFGEKSQKIGYENRKAELFWAGREWLKKGGLLVDNPGWIELPWIKYKIQSDKAVRIQPRQDVIMQHGRSPDIASAYALTFSEDTDMLYNRREMEESERNKQEWRDAGFVGNDDGFGFIK